MHRFGAICLLAALAVACAQTQDDDAAPERTPAEDGEAKSLDEMRAESLAQLDTAQCEAEGGEVRQEGLLGLWRCVKPYPDAGEQCRGDEVCAGRCLGDDAVTDYEAPPGGMIGLCEADDSPFGCFAVIEDGSTGGMICVD